MNPIMDNFVSGESYHNPAKQNDAGRRSECEEETYPSERYWHPSADGKDCARVFVMHLMQGLSECPECMA